MTHLTAAATRGAHGAVERLLQVVRTPALRVGLGRSHLEPR